ncbi:hypothetical protein [Leifsonia shinshuensis]|uniref:hypothetical protein n=1 Tax=Leifsonia shinshuensis TaxID=150026 RepID=UPI00285A81B9|nr:hypothetical protein [Leifsonia shinshuensis]MDR6972080.1 hypothetical protein [Leifsonia shinshuensis]
MVAEERDGSGRDSGFDPRYDPSFQRGYQPQPGERPQVRVRADAPQSAYRRPTSVLGSESAPAETAWPEREAEPAYLPDSIPGSLTPAPLTVASQSGAVEPSIVVASSGVLAGLELNPRRNPYMLALWIVGAGFVVLGIVLYAISVTSSYNGPTPTSDVGSLVFAQIGWMLAGPLITVGLLTLVALLFLTALGARRTRTRERELLEDDEL